MVSRDIRASLCRLGMYSGVDGKPLEDFEQGVS